MVIVGWCPGWVNIYSIHFARIQGMELHFRNFIFIHSSNLSCSTIWHLNWKLDGSVCIGPYDHISHLISNSVMQYSINNKIGIILAVFIIIHPTNEQLLSL